MLQMNCTNCNGIIKSPFLADLSTIECDQCKESVPVKDVFITTKHFNIHREDFHKRSFRFHKLLREFEKELLLMANNKEASPKSIDSLKQVYSSLQELLAGTRDSYRMEVYCNIFVEMNEGSNKSRGKIVNLSTEGASIELLAFDKFPKKRTELDIVFSFNESSELLYSQSKVVWTKEHIKSHESQSTIIGVTFIDIDEHTKNCIWSYIIDNVPIPSHPVSK